MAESFIFIIAEKVLERIGLFLLQEYHYGSDVASDLNRFVDTLSTIKAVLLDAEQQQEKKEELKVWLGRLKNVCYDAEDMLDEYDYEVMQQQAVTHRSFKEKVRNFFSHSNLRFRNKMGHRLVDLRERLDAIAADRGKFHLTVQDEDRRVVPTERETHSFFHASDVIGRDDDKEKMMQHLMCATDGENVSVIPIVGIGGLGKTTLAKLLYNDERVVAHFQLKIWVCVSEDFDVKRLANEIFTSAANTSTSSHSAFDKMQPHGNLTLNDMQKFLRDTLRDKRFLLVLDDVWNEDRVKWIELKNLLMEGANGSRIVVTTRNPSVASVVSPVSPYKLEGLSHDECFSLFVKWAFREGEGNKYKNLLKIGHQIVKKCSGVPLAVRTLGSLLFEKRGERDWLEVKESEIWELKQKEHDILPLLRLSYDHLPSHLKQCFAFCAIFPKAYKFNSLELIRLWIAQGFLKSSNEKRALEDSGHQYIKELSSRSFFQNVKEYGINVLTFDMHDLVHDLASLVAKPDKNNSKSDRHVSRHVSIPKDLPSKEVTSSLPKQNNVRTIIFPVGGAATESFAKACILRFKYLRVLDLRDSRFEVLPSSIGNLKLLRYLNLFNSSIRKLPNSICDLLKLQTLDISKCMELEEVPKDIGNLTELRCLYITTKQMFLPKDGLERLESIQFLAIVACHNLKTLGEGVQHLTTLQTLLIGDCRSLESLPCSMKYLPALETLFIYNCEKIDLMKWEEDSQGLNLSLRSSWIARLPQLVSLPQWLLGAANTLHHLCIGDCLNLTALPEWLQTLTSLQRLVIEDCPKLSALPEGMQSLTALGELKIKNCRELSGRCKRGTGKDWPKIAHVAEIAIDEEISDEVGTSEFNK